MDDPVSAALPEMLPSRHPDVLWADFETETVVLVPGRRVAHHLDAGLSVVFESCDGVTQSAVLVAEVVGSTGREPAEVARWLLGSLDELRQLGVFGEPPDGQSWTEDAPG